jgi:probable rRNA maturation factor
VSPRAAARSTPAPRLRVDVARDGVKGALGDATIRRVARAVIRAERTSVASLSITLVSNARMRALNRRHLRRTRLTDVISFSLPVGNSLAGDVYIAPGAAAASARENGIPLREEMIRLVVHGVLHAVGWNHPEGQGRMRSAMWRRQEALVRRLARVSR